MSAVMPAVRFNHQTADGAMVYAAQWGDARRWFAVRVAPDGARSYATWVDHGAAQDLAGYLYGEGELEDAVLQLDEAVERFLEGE